MDRQTDASAVASPLFLNNYSRYGQQCSSLLAVYTTSRGLTQKHTCDTSALKAKTVSPHARASRLRNLALSVTVLVGIIHMLSGKNKMPHQSSLPGSPARTQHKRTTASRLGAYYPSPGVPEQAHNFTCQRVTTSWRGTCNLAETRASSGRY